MAQVLNTILAGWGYASHEHHLRRLAAIENGEITCYEYDVSQERWRGSVSTVESFQTCSIEAEYKEFLQSLVSKIALRKLSNSSALLIHLGPVWNDVVDFKICVWQMQDCIWESPAGLGICPLEALASICARIHEHLSRIKNPIVILHPHTCSHTGTQLGQFITAAHHIFSTGVESVGDALHIMSLCQNKYNKTDLHSTVSLFPGQKRYCEYLSWILHHPQLVPLGDAGYCIKSVRFRKLEAFHLVSQNQTMYDVPDDQSSWRPERLLMGIYCGGRQMWSGGVKPGSISDEASELEFDTRYFGNENDAYVRVQGDVVIAVWFDDHTSRWTPPRIAYPFHTSFLSVQDDHAQTNVRLFARHLDTPDTSLSYSELAEKEGFWMDMDLEKIDVMPAEQSIAQDIRQNWIQTMKATGGKLKIKEELSKSSMDLVLKDFKKQNVEKSKDGIQVEEGDLEGLDDWSKKCQEALEDLRLHLSKKPIDDSCDSICGSDETISASEEISASIAYGDDLESDTPLRQLYAVDGIYNHGSISSHAQETPFTHELMSEMNPSIAMSKTSLLPPSPPPLPGSAGKTSLPPPSPPPMPGSAGKACPPPPPAPPSMPGKESSPLLQKHKQETPEKEGPKFRSIFWKKNFLKDGTMWADINPVPGLYSIEIDVLKELFTAKEHKPKVARSDVQERIQTPQFQIVDDLTRINNIAIMMKSFSSFGSPSAIRTAILSGDDSLTERQLEQLKQMSPRPKELELISNFSGKPSDLHLPEQLLLELGSVSRLDTKLNVLLFKKQFEVLIRGAIQGMDALNQSCQKIKQSGRLKTIFASILATGNVLNANTARGGASAIKIDSILALADAKVVPKDIDDLHLNNGVKIPRIKTFLDFIAWKIMCEEICTGTMDSSSLQSAAEEGYLFQELGILRHAVLLIESDVVQNVDALERGMKLVEGEITAEERTYTSSPIGTMQKSFESTLQKAAEETSAVTHDTSTHQVTSSFLSMIREFHTTAVSQIEDMRHVAEKASKSQEDIVTWMGERGTLDAPELFKAILTFSRDFDSSFSRVFSSIGKTGVLAFVDFMRKETNQEAPLLPS